MTSKEERKKISEQTSDPGTGTPKTDCDVLWDEILYMNFDESKVKLVQRTKSELVLKALVNEAFSDKYILSHLLGSIMYPDCKIEIDKKTLMDENDPGKGKKSFAFLLRSPDATGGYKGKLVMHL